jgi:hypothetical protein
MGNVEQRPMGQPTSTRPITGDDIISELIRNVEAGAFKVRYTTLVPCVFNVYLHPEDFEQIRPIAGFVRSEARQALDEHLASLNKGSALPSVTKWLGLGSNRQPEFKALNEAWTIEFHRDEEERLRRGDIEIYSELGSSEHEELGAGAKTTFITRRPMDAPPDPAVMPAETAAAQPRTERKAWAYLRFIGQAGPTTFPITRDQTVIGRGGKAFWVDLKIEGPADVSREHCRIRRDPATGKFTIKDVSQYGTSVDGQRVPTSLERAADGSKIDRNVETPLPDRAKIGLADIFFLEFETVQPE